MKLTRSVSSQLWLTALAWLIIGSFLAIAACTNPSGDDWTYAASVQQHWFVTQWQWYQAWSGRVSATAVQTAMAFDLSLGVRLSALGLLVNMLALCYCWAARFDAGPWGPLPPLLCAAGLLLFPSPGEGIMWLAAAAGYTWPLVAAAWVATLCYTTQATNRWGLRLGLAIPLALYACMGTETSTAFLGSSATLGLIFGGRRWRNYSMLMFVAAIIGTIVIVTAPGTLARLSGIETPPTESLSLSNVATQLAQRLSSLAWSLVQNPALGLPILLAIAYLPQCAQTKPRSWWCASCWLAVAAITAFPASLIPGAFAPRVANVVSIPLIIVAVFIAVQLAVYISRTTAQLRSPAHHLLWPIAVVPTILSLPLWLWPCAVGILAVLFIGRLPMVQRRGQLSRLILVSCCLLAAPRLPILLHDAIERAPAWNAHWQHNYQLLSAAGEQDDVALPLFSSDPPRLIYRHEPSGNTSGWINRGIADWAKVRSVKVVVDVEAEKADKTDEADEAQVEVSPSPQHTEP